MAFCTYCGQSFQRNDHLERHLATHANIKRFKCETCHLSFSRRDVLQRHHVVHGDSSGTAVTSGLGATGAGLRQRTPEACRSCARTKTKCDSSTPCNRCRARGISCDRRSRKHRAGADSRSINKDAALMPTSASETVRTSADAQSSDLCRNNGIDVERARESSNDLNREGIRQTTPAADSVAQEEAAPFRSDDHSLVATETAADSEAQEATASVHGGDRNLCTPPVISPTTEMAVLDDAAIESVMSSWLDSYPDSTPRPNIGQTSNMSAASNNTGVDSIEVRQALIKAGWAATESPRRGPGDSAAPLKENYVPGGNLGDDANDSDSADLWQDPSSQGHQRDHWRTASTAGTGAVDHPVIIDAYRYWSYFRCNPATDVTKCPRTAGVLLESLSQMPEADEFWGWLGLNFPSPNPFEPLVSLPLREPVRDKLAAISQSLLQKALWVHQLDPAAAAAASCYPSPPPSSTAASGTTASTNGTRNFGISGQGPGPGKGVGAGFRGFLILPPAATLEHFLREYMRIFEPFYPLLPSGVLEVNTLLDGSHDTISTLLILLMIGQGAISDPSSEARRLSGGLTEVCRISLYDAMELDVSSSHHHLLLHCSLIFAAQAAWSGDKWLMDISLGQRGIYIAVIRNSILFEDKDEAAPPASHEPELTRVIYAWVVLDLELSLFHDTVLNVQIADLNLTLLYTDEVPTQKPPTAKVTTPPSLRTLFQWFLAGKLSSADMRVFLTPTTLRLLLHPLHGIVHGHRQMLSCFSDGPASLPYIAPVTKLSVDVRMEETQALLQRWYDLYRLCMLEETTKQMQQQQQAGIASPNHIFAFRSPLMSAVLVTFHIIYLNTVTDFVEIERLARTRAPRLSDAQLYHQTYPAQVARYLPRLEDALWHCGQVVRLLQSFDRKVRPPWWPAALYRVTLTLWAASVYYGPRWRATKATRDLSAVPIDVDPEDDCGSTKGNEHQTLLAVRCLTGIPALTDRRARNVENGACGPASLPLVTLDDPIQTVEACLWILESGVTTRFSEGIHSRLTQFLAGRYVMRTP